MRERPRKIREPEDMTAENIEYMMQWIEGQFRELHDTIQGLTSRIEALEESE